MKILFVVEHFYPYVGGAEELFLNLTVSLAETGHEINVVTTLHDHSEKKYEVYKGVKITRINCYNRFLFTVFGLPEILRKARNADFIHTTSYNSAIPSYLAGLICRKKVVITFHEVWGNLWFNMPYTPKWQLLGFYIFETFILKLSFYKYIAVSDYTLKSLTERGIPEAKIEKIYNGLDYRMLNTFHYTPPEQFTFCFFGRLGISKGIDLLVPAAEIFFERHPDALLKLIIPTYPKITYRKVIRQIQEKIPAENIQILHNLTKPDLLQAITTSSCVVIPSRSEGFCFAAQEAVATGVPIISSGKGSLPEVVGGQHITLGELTIDQIVSALEMAFDNQWDYTPPPLFELSTSVEQYLKFYQSLLNEKR